MDKYKSIDFPEKESFYQYKKLYYLEYQFDEIQDEGGLVIYSQENINSFAGWSNLQEERNKKFEECILVQIRVAHGIVQ